MTSGAEDVEALFDTIRAAAKPGIWSLGVQLARRQAVQRETASGNELAFRVTGTGRVPVTVFLDPSAEEWECECDSTQDVCEHAAAAVIALRRVAEEPSAELEQAPERGHIAYRFIEDGRALRLERLVVHGDQSTPLGVSVQSLVRRPDANVEVRALDLKLEETLGARPADTINTGLMQRVLRVLGDSEHVQLGNQRIQVHGDPVLPIAVVEDRGDGFFVSLRRDPSVSRAFTNGAALCGTLLRPIGEARLTQREREELTPGRYFGPEKLQELVSEVLPGLERRLRVQRSTTRLPETIRTAPRIRVEVEREGDALRVQGCVVYGDPPIARVENGMLRLLGNVLPIRRLEDESRLEARLRSQLGIPAGQVQQLAPHEAIALRPRLEALGSALAGNAHRGFFLAPPLDVSLDLDPSQLRIDFRTRVGGRDVHVDAGRALESWNAGSDLAALPGGGFAPLPADFLRRHGRIVADLLAAKGTREALPPHALPDLARLCESLGAEPPPELQNLRALLADFSELPPAELPSDLHVRLREYQQRGVAWLAFLRRAGLGALLADDMGLGKTLQALCAARGRTLVVSPTSVVYGWADQIRRFLPSARVAIYHGPKRSLDPSADFTLTTYALLRLDSEQLTAVDWACAILDEAQTIKNASSQVAQAAYRLRADFRVALTGTPIENRLEELWSELHFLNPGMLGTQSDFKQRYVRPIEAGEPGVAEHLRRRIRPFVLRRLKADVELELPPRTENVLHCELTSEERAVYDAVRAAARSDVAARLASGGNVLEVLEALLRLRQAACHPALVPGSTTNTGTSSKLDVLLDALEEVAAEGHRSLVFSQWTSLLDLVEPQLNGRALRFSRLDGSTRDREGVVTEFQAPSGPPVLLISLRAGGTGLNLTAADHVFLLDPWWNPAVEDQAADRVHRIGQERPVFIYRLVAIDTVEERILALQQKKRAIAEVALAGAQSATSITREELLDLLE